MKSGAKGILWGIGICFVGIFVQAHGGNLHYTDIIKVGLLTILVGLCFLLWRGE